MDFPVTTILTALAALALVALSLPVSLRRRKTAISAGDGGDESLRRLIRAQGNFIEYVPLTLIAIALAEAGGIEPVVLWTLGAVAGAGRLLHAVGMLSDRLPPKAIGMVLTFLALLGAAVALACVALKA